MKVIRNLSSTDSQREVGSTILAQAPVCWISAPSCPPLQPSTCNVENTVTLCTSPVRAPAWAACGCCTCLQWEAAYGTSGRTVKTKQQPLLMAVKQQMLLYVPIICFRAIRGRGSRKPSTPSKTSFEISICTCAHTRVHLSKEKWRHLRVILQFNSQQASAQRTTGSAGLMCCKIWILVHFAETCKVTGWTLS